MKRQDQNNPGSILGRLIDPQSEWHLSLPGSASDLYVQADTRDLLAFDNLSFIPGAVSDALCRLSTGGGLLKRRLYTDGDVKAFSALRPVILTSIPDVVSRRRDLLDRSINIEMQQMGSRVRTTESSLMSAFEARPWILGALFDAVAAALAGEAGAKSSIPELPRMADFTVWGFSSHSSPALFVPGFPHGVRNESFR